MNKTHMDYMGNTPMVKLNHMVPNNYADVYVKLEGCNPGGSKKSRVALQMLLNAEKEELLCQSKRPHLLEPTGGNTGLGLTLMAIKRGYDISLVIPDNYSKQNIIMLRRYGANVILSDSTKGNDSHIIKVKEMVAENSDYIWLDQLKNPGNPQAHYNFTGKEIVEQVNNIDCFVSAVGSGGTITGVGQRLKERNAKTIIVAMQPLGCNVIEGKALPHKIQGVSIGFVAPIFNTSIVDRCESVTYEDAIYVAGDLMKKEGLFLGISSCANISVALRIAKELGRGKKVVTESADFGYIYNDFYDEVFASKKMD